MVTRAEFPCDVISRVVGASLGPRTVNVYPTEEFPKRSVCFILLSGEEERGEISGRELLSSAEKTEGRDVFEFQLRVKFDALICFLLLEKKGGRIG